MILTYMNVKNYLKNRFILFHNNYNENENENENDNDNDNIF